MAGPKGLPWDAPLSPDQTIGWVFQAGPDEPLSRWLRPGATHEWSDARAAGKEAGLPVLFLQGGPGPPMWAGWGNILEPLERWRVYGVRTVCVGSLNPLMDVVDPSIAAGRIPSSESEWENRALGTALGLLRFRDRTPYRDVGACDLRLTSSDLLHLARLQPQLRYLGRTGPPIPLSGEWARHGSTASVSDRVSAASDPVELSTAEKLVVKDLKQLFGDEIRFSSLKTTPGRFQGRDYWVVEGSFWSNFVPRNFQYVVAVDTGELAAKRIDQ